MAPGNISYARAFCPAHITGFFKAHISHDTAPNRDDTCARTGSTRCNNVQYNRGSRNRDDTCARTGSTGAGFSLAAGVTTSVETRGNQDANGYTITTDWQGSTDLSERVIEIFLERTKITNVRIDACHKASIPVGYGLGSSGAVALSLAYALDGALETHMRREEIGRIAHMAEIDCRTGLGDVLASYHGGFEIRTTPGAPGVGRVESIPAGGLSAVVLCLAPVSTSEFLKERLPMINGLGGVMTERLMQTKNSRDFQSMSLEFAERIGTITPRMHGIIDELQEAGIGCGIALFGETIFCMVRPKSPEEYKAVEIFKRHPEGITIRSDLDETGARLLCN